jgi:putative membrane protein
VSRLADGAGQSAAGAADLASGADQLASGTAGVADGAKGLADGLATTAERTQVIPGSASKLATGATDVSGGVDELVGGIEQACANELSAPFYAQFCAKLPELRQLRQGAQQVAGGMTDLAGQGGEQPTGLYELSAGISGLAGGAGQLAGGAEQVSGGAAELAGGAHQLAGGLPELQTGADQAAVGVAQLSTGARELSGGAGGIASGATELADGVGQLETGTNQLAEGVEGLAGGVGELAGGAKELSTGLDQATEEIPTYTEQERKSLASVVADPVATDGEVTDLDTGATGPMFAVLALWLGALALMIVFSPVPLHARGSTRGALRLTLETFALPAVVGLVTGLGTGAVLAGIEDLGPGGWAATMGFGALASVAFVAVNQALAAALGHVGRGISLLVAVLVIATGVVSTVPGVLDGLAAFLPVGAGLDGLVGLTRPGVGGVGMAIAAMVLWCIAGLAVTMLMVARQRTVRVGELLRTA